MSSFADDTNFAPNNAHSDSANSGSIRSEHVGVPHMARGKGKINYWTASDLKTLRRLAGKRPAKGIAKELKRSEVAIRLKASQEGISLRVE